MVLFQTSENLVGGASSRDLFAAATSGFTCSPEVTPRHRLVVQNVSTYDVLVGLENVPRYVLKPDAELSWEVPPGGRVYALADASAPNFAEVRVTAVLL